MADDDRWKNDPERNSYRDVRDDRFGDDHGVVRRSAYAGGYRGGGYGAESYSRSYPDLMRRAERQGFDRGHDYNRGFSRADNRSRGERGPHQDMWGYRGERSGWERASDELASWFGNNEAERRRQQDARRGDQGAQHHRGRGPKGYTRSDERILEDVSDRLTDDPYLDASEIGVSVRRREITLSGTVARREDKRIAEDIAENVPGVAHVQNNLRVQSTVAG